MRSCEECGSAFEIAKPHLVHQKYCGPRCSLDAFNRRRRNRPKETRPSDAMGPKVPDIAFGCYCGQPLIGIGLDWNGTTIEICASGHETSCVTRRQPTWSPPAAASSAAR